METIRRSRAVVIVVALLAAVVALTLVWEDPAEAGKKKRRWVDQIVFASNQSIVPGDPSTTDMEIFSIKPDGTGLKQLTVNAKLDDGHTMSPNGAKIAYSHEFDSAIGDRDILVMNRDGSNTRFLTTSTDTEWTPDWSPDGSKIAYTRGTGFASDIWVMNAADGSGKAQIYIGPDQADFRPVFSPDGKKVAFTWGANTIADFEICEVNSTPGASPFPLCVTDNTTDDYRPEYSPNGSKIYYDSAGVSSSNPEGDFEVMATTLDGSITTNLTNNTTDDLRPSARRTGTGTRLVYEKLSSTSTNSKSTPRVPGTYTSELFIMDANGGNKRAIPNIDSSKTNQSPDWVGYWKRVRR